MSMFTKVFGTRSQREVKRIMPLVEKTEALRPEMQQLTDEQLREKNTNLQAKFWEEAIKLQAQLNSAKKILKIDK